MIGPRNGVSSYPYLFFGLPGGVYADRWDRKRTMLGAEILRTGVVLIIPVSATLVGLNIWVIAAVAFALATIRCFYHPSMKSTVASILRDPERSAGVSLMEATTRSMQVIGLAAGGFLISGIGAQNLILVSAVLFAVSVVLLWSLVVPLRNRAPEPQTLWSDMVESLQYVARMPSLFWAFALFLFGLLIVVGLERVGLPILSDTLWGRGPDGFGILLSNFSLGSILGSLVLGRDDIKRLSLCMTVGWAVWGLSFAALAVSPFNPYIAQVSSSVSGKLTDFLMRPLSHEFFCALALSAAKKAPRLGRNEPCSHAVATSRSCFLERRTDLSCRFC